MTKELHKKDNCGCTACLEEFANKHFFKERIKITKDRSQRIIFIALDLPDWKHPHYSMENKIRGFFIGWLELNVYPQPLTEFALDLRTEFKLDPTNQSIVNDILNSFNQSQIPQFSEEDWEAVQIETTYNELKDTIHIIEVKQMIKIISSDTNSSDLTDTDIIKNLMRAK
jgi:hypothetical protein